MSDLSAMRPRDPRVRALLIKYFDADAWGREHGDAEGRRLPYAVELLESYGIALEWSDRAWREPWSSRIVRSVIEPLELLGAPFVDTLLSTGRIGRADAVLSVFESQAMSLAFIRALGVSPFTRPRLIVVSCWLAELLPRYSPTRLALYRFAYRGVDRIVYFSRNQGAVYERLLRMPADRLAYVPFGVDAQFFSPISATEDFDVLAVGRDRGRDWKTFFAAVEGTGWRVAMACRPSEIAGLRVPDNVMIVGFVDRVTYRDLTARARVIVVPTHELAYPTGQSVVLEALAMAKCCVVTDTPAMRDYVVDGENGLLVPAHDADLLRAGVGRALDDTALRTRLGSAGRRSVEADFNVDRMWERVAQIIGGTEAPRA